MLTKECFALTKELFMHTKSEVGSITLSTAMMYDMGF